MELRGRWLALRPFPHFDAEDAAAPTYGVELDLDHARSYITAMLDAFTVGSPHFRFEERIQQDLDELRTIAANLDAADPRDDVSTPLREYIAQTQQLLESFRSEYAAWAASHVEPRKPRSPAG